MIQVSSFAVNPLYQDEGDDGNNAFIRIFGIDLKIKLGYKYRNDALFGELETF